MRIGRGVRQGAGGFGDVGLGLDVRQRAVVFDHAEVIQIVLRVARQQDAPVHRQAFFHGAGQLPDHGRAVGGDGLVKARLGGQIIAEADIGQEQGLPLRRRHGQREDGDVLVARMGAQLDDVLFGGPDQDQFELFEEAADFGKLLVLFTADFGGEHHMLAVRKAEADHGVGDVGAGPDGADEIDGFELIQIDRLADPARLAIIAGAPAKVAHIGQMHGGALDIGHHSA